MISLTHFAEHASYRFTRAEIALKVRLLVAETMGVPVKQVREESNFVWDFA